MLELRPNCECCDRDLPPDSRDALICSFECTWCRDCADNRLPGGSAVPPAPRRNSGRRRPAEKLAKFPAGTVRKRSKLEACAAG